MWFLPSFGRPHALARMARAPGGLPPSVTVLVNEDDPKREEYIAAGREAWKEGAPTQWHIVAIPPGSRCADAHRFITTKWPDEEFFGLLCDDQWPITPGWHEAMVRAAGDRYITTPAGESRFPLCRTAVGFGGDLVRVIGSLVPIQVKHNFEDNFWDTIAADHDLLRPLPDFIVEHRHWKLIGAERDATYLRGSHDMDDDRRIFAEWLGSNERKELNARIAKFLGAEVAR